MIASPYCRSQFNNAIQWHTGKVLVPECFVTPLIERACNHSPVCVRGGQHACCQAFDCKDYGILTVNLAVMTSVMFVPAVHLSRLGPVHPAVQVAEGVPGVMSLATHFLRYIAHSVVELLDT